MYKQRFPKNLDNALGLDNGVLGFNLSPVTPIICIQLPIEVLGKRKIGEPEYTR